MASESLGPLWGGLVWIGTGVAFHILKRYCGRELEGLSSARKVTSIKELTGIAGKDEKQQQQIVAVVGRVNADNPVKCKNSRISAVVLEESVEQFFLRQVNGNSWIKDSTFLVGSKQIVPWYLEDSTARVNVEGAKNAAEFDLVVASDVIEEPTPSNHVRTVLDIAQGIRVLCIRRVERILPVGTLLTVVAEVAKVDQGAVVLRRPRRGGPFVVSTKSLELLVSELGASSSWCKWLSIGCTAVGLVSLAHSALQLYLDRRRARNIRPQSRGSVRPGDNFDLQIVDGAEGERSGPSQSYCVICLDREYNIAFFPCGHVCCCKDCTDGVHHCPLCRQRISQKKFVYLH